MSTTSSMTNPTVRREKPNEIMELVTSRTRCKRRGALRVPFRILPPAPVLLAVVQITCPKYMVELIADIDCLVEPEARALLDHCCVLVPAVAFEAALVSRQMRAHKREGGAAVVKLGHNPAFVAIEVAYFSIVRVRVLDNPTCAHSYVGKYQPRML